MLHRLRRAAGGALRDVLDAVFPAACRLCGAGLPPAGGSLPRAARPYAALWDGTLQRTFAGFGVPLHVLCPACAAGIERARSGFVPGAGARIASAACFAPGPAAFAVVHAFKYAGGRELAPWLGALAAGALRRQLGAPWADATLVPVPLAAPREAERGYNQSALLAHAVAHRLGMPIDATRLARVRATRPQAQLDDAARRANVDGAFATRGRRRAGRILLVDDVLTSGATARAALAALGHPEAAVLCIVRARDAG